MEKTNNAYMLVYQRVLMLPTNLLDSINNQRQDDLYQDLQLEFDKLPRDYRQRKPVQLCKKIMAKLGEEREDYLYRQFIFHHDYIRFVVNLLTSCKIPSEVNYLKRVIGAEVQIFGFTFFFTTALRSTLSPLLCEIVTYLKECCISHKGLCIFIAGMFSIPAIIREFLLDCPRPEARKLVLIILRAVMESLYHDEQKLIESYVKDNSFLLPATLKKMATSRTLTFGKRKNTESEDNAVIVDHSFSQIVSSLDHEVPYLILLIDAFLQQTTKITEAYCGEFFRVFTIFAKLGPETKIYLRLCGVIGVALEAFGFNKAKDCSAYATSGIPHFTWGGDPLFEPIQNEAVMIDRNVHDKNFPAQIPYIFQTVYALLDMNETTELKMNANIQNQENKYFSYFSEDKNIRTLLNSSSISKIGLSNISHIFAFLCETKKDAVTNPYINFLFKGLLTCRYQEIEKYLFPLYVLLQTKNDALFSVYILAYL